MSAAITTARMTHDEAILRLREDPATAGVVRDNYLGADVREAALRFHASAEFSEVLALVGGVRGKTVVDIGAGNGMASYAFARSGAAEVYAIEPDDSPLVGRTAMRRVIDGLPIRSIDAFGEDLPLADGSVDVAYCRATLHHVRELDPFIAECARVLKPGGVLLACREHVAENARELARFLEGHPVHRLAGGENAFPLRTYTGAFVRAGLRIEAVIGQWDSVVNAFPTVASQSELRLLAREKLRRKLGPLAPALRGLEPIADRWIKRPLPGRLYSFLARKP
jgi:2-polyprenyl-3-methyl-5-hydroxy-6-metoxy-1,4-benzoquinol methylase